MRALSTIKGRLAVAMVFLGLLLVMIGGLGMAGMHASNSTTRTIHENQMPGVVAVSMTEMYTASERITLDRAAIFAGTPDVDAIIGRSHVTRKRADDAWKQFAALAQTPATASLAATFDAQRHAVLAIIDTGYGEVRSNDQTRIRASAKALQAAFAPFAAAGTALREAQFEEARSSYARSQATYERFQTISIVAILAGLAAAGLAWWSLRVAIARPLNTALAQFDAIASGDLRRELVVTSHDEMAQLLNGLAKMQSSLMQTVLAVRNGSESISVATKEIASGNLDLSSRTEEQAAALQQTVASMDELIVTVRANTDNARQASVLATAASQIADRGSHVVSQVVTTMREINDSSGKIADIISIIDGIAFQTNILALNAAVEAARAGEQGRGFAVVAAEVRNLAQRSAGAAKEIKTLIETSVTRVNSGTSLVGDAGQTMAEMTVAIQRVTRIMSDIASASAEQNQGLEQISASVAQMDQVTQQNAALVEQAAAAAHSLEDQASILRATVSVFQLTDRATPRLAAA